MHELSQLFKDCGKSHADAVKVKNFILEKLPIWEKTQRDRYLRKGDTGLSFTVQYSALTKKTFIHFKRRLNDPEIVGNGHYKKVVYTLDFDTLALSVKSISKLISPAYRAVASNEYRALASLQGISGVPTLQGGMTYMGKDGVLRFALITPFCEGKDLYSALYEEGSPASSLTTSQRYWIFWDIINTIVEVHRRGICHRDLKVENILVSWNEQLNRWGGVVGDFGGAATIQHVVSVNLEGEQVIAPTDKEDSIALGVVLWQLFRQEVGNDQELQGIYNWLVHPCIDKRCHVQEIIPLMQEWGYRRML